ncbi:MAG: four helix bundle protein, partial [Candidatus Kryptonium sp.]|nr:four helix bundle protein [Candidatus Kryptonium sp.]
DTGKEYARYLRIARASANETDYWLHVARDCKLITDESYERMISLTDECLRMLSSMITKLRAASERYLQEHSEPYVSYGDPDL